VTQPNVSLDEARDIILVELPGIDNPERARGFLQASAALEFWDVHLVNEVIAGFSQADALLKVQEGIEDEEPDSLGNGGTLNLQGPLLSNLRLNQGGAVMGLADRNQRETISGYLERDDIRAFFPSNGKFLWSAIQ